MFNSRTVMGHHTLLYYIVPKIHSGFKFQRTGLIVLMTINLWSNISDNISIWFILLFNKSKFIWTHFGGINFNPISRFKKKFPLHIVCVEMWSQLELAKLQPFSFSDGEIARFQLILYVDKNTQLDWTNVAKRNTAGKN